MKFDTAPVMPVVLPQGRLTLTTVVPVLRAAVATSANVLYTPYVGNLVPIWDGVQFKPQIFTELTNVLANAATGSAGPAAGAASQNYDIFVWSNAGVMTLTRGPVWTSDSARSAGTALLMTNGVLVNNASITNGPAAGYGTYVGTVRTDAGGATVSWSLGAQGAAATINVWNMYNRVDVKTWVQDASVSWAYTTATIRSANNSVVNRVSFIRGLDEEGMEATYETRMSTVAGVNSFAFIGLGLDSTSAFAAQGLGGGGNHQGILLNALAAGDTSATIPTGYRGYPGLGFHFLQALEQGDGTNATTFFGQLYGSLWGAMRA